jgi:uncharacterized membrane protein YraQ (UPF0718 family)/copper chaperone CopZ
MLDTIYTVVVEFWSVLAEMAPYLILGFLVAGVLSVTVSTRLVERHLGDRGIWSVTKASLLGIPLPLCSCGVIPVAASLRRHGASRGATTSFLLSTPQTGVDSIMVTFSLLGPVFAIFRPVAALVTGLIGGQLVESFGNGKNDISLPVASNNGGLSDLRLSERVTQGFKYGFVALPQDIGKSLLLGLLIAGCIAAIIPDDFFLGLIGAGIGSMLIMMLLGIPVYVCATASVPIAAVLIAKGISPGAALVFLVTGPATNAAAITTIWKVLGRRTTFIYLATVAFTALASGLLLDQILSGAGSNIIHQHHTMLPEWLQIASSLALVAILLYAVLSPYFARRSKTGVPDVPPAAVLGVDGMTCLHCASKVKDALAECDGVDIVDVDLKSKSAKIYGKSPDVPNMKKVVEDLGYSIIDKDAK